MTYVKVLPQSRPDILLAIVSVYSSAANNWSHCLIAPTLLLADRYETGLIRCCLHEMLPTLNDRAPAHDSLFASVCGGTLTSLAIVASYTLLIHLD
eukprot:SAG31_NODE_6282_length_2088_cov_1.201106_2_plen_96_part_00